ncbi:MAG: hypothetical protein KDA41_08245, partial [Planctomycetales bacterium]|nr:hypothetical protein [Planctomycetales bacterium]
SPARIFMGDCGSGLLGFLVAVAALFGERRGSLPIWFWLVLMGGFLTDATLTLVRRIVLGERWREPHRSHLYQLAVQAGFSHSVVATASMTLTAALGGLALAVWRFPLLVPAAVLGSAAALLVGWVAARKAMQRRINASAVSLAQNGKTIAAPKSGQDGRRKAA